MNTNTCTSQSNITYTVCINTESNRILQQLPEVLSFYYILNILKDTNVVYDPLKQRAVTREKIITGSLMFGKLTV